MGVFNGRAPGGKNAVWKLTVNFEMPSSNPGTKVELKRVVAHQQHCILGPVPAGKNLPCSVTFTDSIGNPNHAVKGSTTYLPNAEGRSAASSAIASIDADANANAAAAAPRVSLLSADDQIEVILPPPPPLPPMEASPHAIGKTKKKRKKVRAPDDASTATPPPPTAPTAKKSKTTKKKKAAEPVDLLCNANVGVDEQHKEASRSGDCPQAKMGGRRCCDNHRQCRQ